MPERSYVREDRHIARRAGDFLPQCRAAALKSALVDVSGNEVRLASPCTGTILKLWVKDSGALLREGETVAELACGGDKLQAELIVPETGVGKLRLNQNVRLKYDAFPYQRFGVKSGRLVWLNPAKTAGEDGAFKARVELTDQEISVKGRPRPFAAGMGGTAEIVVGKRTLLSYALEPIRQLRENLADTP